MDILYHHRTQGTGAEGVHIAYIIKGFRELGHRVHVVSPSGENPLETAGSNPYAKKGGFKSKVLISLSRSLPQFCFELLEIAYNLAAYLKLRRVISRQRIQFIYERNAFFLFAGAFLAKRYKIPYVVEVNEIAGEKRVRKQFLVRLAKFIERLVFERADAIIVVSDFLKEKICEQGIGGSKVHVMANAVDITLFDPEKVQSRVRDNLGISSQTVVLGFIGWFVAWHNLERLIRVAGTIAKSKDIVLVLVGDGILKGDLCRIAEGHGLKNKLLLPGAVSYSQIPEYIEMMDVCVIPASNDYRSPIKLFEYMAMAKPVVAPCLKPIERVIIDKQDGMLFSPDDESSLQQSLEYCIEHPEQRMTFGKNARNKISGKYTWRINAERIVSIVSEL